VTPALAPYPAVDHGDGSPAGSVAHQDFVEGFHPEIVAMARAARLATLPDGWSRYLYRASHLTLVSPNREHWVVSPSINPVGLWAARIAPLGTISESTMHATIQQAIDAVVARDQALAVGAYEVAS
jgi:hypothetical protein